MFQIGLPEILIIFIVVLVFLNPKELPGMMRRLGKLLQQLKSLRETFLQEVRTMEAEIPSPPDGGKETESARRSRLMQIPVQSGSVSLGCEIHGELPPQVPTAVHILISTGIGDRIVFQGVVRHAVETRAQDSRIVTVTYDLGDGYSVKDYRPLPHEAWAIPWSARSEELESGTARLMHGIASSVFPDSKTVEIFEYRDDVCREGAGFRITAVELYSFYANSIAPLGIYPEFAVRSEALDEARQVLAQAIEGFGERPLVALHNRRRGSMTFKNTCTADMCELAGFLKRHEAALILFSDPGGSADLEELCDYVCPQDPSLQVPAALLKLSDVFIGGDSGPAHLAAAVGTPVVSLRNPDQSALNGPFCRKEALACVAASLTERSGNPELSFDARSAALRALELLGRNRHS